MQRTKWAYHGAWLVSLVVAVGGRAAPPGDSVASPPPGVAAPADIAWASSALAANTSVDRPGTETPRAGPTSVLERSLNGSQTLDRPLERPAPAQEDFVAMPEGGALFQYPIDPPLGFTGRSSIVPSEQQGDNDFMPIEDRWRLGLPPWDRYGKGHPLLDDYPYVEGTFWNPYKQSVFKGDYPISGQHTFFIFSGTSITTFDGHQVPTPTTPFESTTRPRREEFFGSPNQLLTEQILRTRFELFHGDAAFKPLDWSIVATPAFNYNQLNVDELGVTSPDVRKGTQRERSFATVEEYFIETKLADTSPYYDFVSLRVGSQPFVSDFRGFLFNDTNRAIRLFGSAESNRDQFNLVYFRQAEKDTDSGLNTFHDRGQDIVIANFFRQDFIFPGYQVLANFHYNHDPASFHFDRNGFLVRPDPVGTFQPHTLDVFYLGFGGDGHIGHYNITHQTYFAFGHDSQNPLANRGQDIQAWFNAVELSYDRDWARFRTSFLYSSGDRNTNNRHATGFDSIQDDPNFAGGMFSYFQRQGIPLFGAKVTNGLSLIPDLRSSKIQGQANFVNPGLILYNVGFDADITPKLRMFNNVNFLWFDSTESLQTFVYADHIDTHIGTDINTGIQYRPFLSNNAIILMGISTLVPGNGFKALFNQARDNLDPLVAAFVTMNFNF